MKSYLSSLFFVINFLFSQTDFENAQNAYDLRSAGSVKNTASQSNINSAIRYYNSSFNQKSNHGNLSSLKSIAASGPKSNSPAKLLLIFVGP